MENYNNKIECEVKDGVCGKIKRYLIMGLEECNI